jgi:hypothetical protein
MQHLRTAVTLVGPCDHGLDPQVEITLQGVARRQASQLALNDPVCYLFDSCLRNTHAGLRPVWSITLA